jgi:hypothetical protein
MNGMKQTCLVLSASTYKITDEKTGETNSGLTVFYLPTDSLSPTEDATAKERGQIAHGIQPSKVSMPYSAQSKVVAAPGLYEITFQMVTRQLKTQIQPVDMKFIGVANIQRATVTK